MILPRARTTNIVVQQLDDEVLIYDLTLNKAHSLNSTASIVFNACDGSATLNELKEKSKLPDELIFFTLDELRKVNLLEENVNYDLPFVGMSRREVIRKVGLASMVALPIISSFIAPRAVAAASLLAPGALLYGGLTCGLALPACASTCVTPPNGALCASGSTVVSGPACPDCVCSCA